MIESERTVLFFISTSKRKIPQRTNRLLKNARLHRFPHPSSLQRTSKYASFLRISGALHPDIFEQPAKNDFFSNPLKDTLTHFFYVAIDFIA